MKRSIADRRDSKSAPDKDREPTAGHGLRAIFTNVRTMFVLWPAGLVAIVVILFLATTIAHMRVDGSDPDQPPGVSVDVQVGQCLTGTELNVVLAEPRLVDCGSVEAAYRVIGLATVPGSLYRQQTVGDSCDRFPGATALTFVRDQQNVAAMTVLCLAKAS